MKRPCVDLQRLKGQPIMEMRQAEIDDLKQFVWCAAWVFGAMGTGVVIWVVVVSLIWGA